MTWILIFSKICGHNILFITNNGNSSLALICKCAFPPTSAHSRQYKMASGPVTPRAELQCASKFPLKVKVKQAEHLPRPNADIREESLSYTSVHDWCKKISEDHEEVAK
jgi:hypothetical protein